MDNEIFIVQFADPHKHFLQIIFKKSEFHIEIIQNMLYNRNNYAEYENCCAKNRKRRIFYV